MIPASTSPRDAFLDRLAALLVDLAIVAVIESVALTGIVPRETALAGIGWVVRSIMSPSVPSLSVLRWMSELNPIRPTMPPPP